MHSETRSTAWCGTLLMDMACLPEHGAEAMLLDVMTVLTRLLSRSCGAQPGGRPGGHAACIPGIPAGRQAPVKQALMALVGQPVQGVVVH